MNLLLAVLLLLAPVKIEHGRFNIIKDGKKIGTDEFSIAKKGTGYSMDGKVTIGDLTISSQMELNDKLVPVSYEASSREGTIRVKVTPTISELETIVGGETSSADFRFPEGAVILDNNFFHHYLMLLYRAQAGQTSVPVFVPQDRSVGSAIVRSMGARTYDLEVGDVKMQATTDAEGTLIKLTVPAASVVVER
ncbi:MAG TPA: hypothetical protein VGJ22_12950 [Anaerolineales bacterium]|jgi:hypothetical protein